MKREWTVGDEQILKKMYSKNIMKKIAEKLGRSEGAVRSRAKFLKLTKKDEGYIHPNPNPITRTTVFHTCVWHHEGMKIKEIAKCFDRPESIIQEIIDEAEKSYMYEKYVSQSEIHGIFGRGGHRTPVSRKKR